MAGDDFDEVGGGGESGDVEAVGTPEVQQCLSERRDDLYLFYIAEGGAGAAVHHGDGALRVDAYGGNGIGDDRNLDSFKGLAMGNTRNGVKKAYDKSKYGFVIVFVGVFHKALFVCLFFACKYTNII